MLQKKSLWLFLGMCLVKALNSWIEYLQPVNPTVLVVIYLRGL
jgi:hypothetical protein